MTEFFVIKNSEIRSRAADAVLRIPPTDGRPYQVIIKPYVHSRTIEQNNKFHKLIRNMAEFTGYDFDEMKSIICSKFLGTRQAIDPDTGSVIQYTPSTSALSIPDFADLIEQTEALASELGVDNDRDNRTS